MNDQYFLLFPTCIPVKGINSSIIMDLDRGVYLEIPETLYNVLSVELERCTIHEVMSRFEHQYDEGIKGYFNFLADHQYGFFTKNPKPFRKPDDVFYSPYKVISSVLAIDKNSSYDLSGVITQLKELSCQILQIRLYTPYSIQKLTTLLAPLQSSSIKICKIYLCYDSNLSEEDLKNVAIEYPNLVVIVHSAPVKKQVPVSKDSERSIVFTRAMITKDTKEVYKHDVFAISHSMYYESRHYNAGLNRKVCVDTDGSIKNYLSHKKIFGNIDQIKLSEIIDSSEFQEKYTITNDQIEKCKTCQFRYMCVSNSDIIQKDNQYFKEHSCELEF